MSELKGCPFCGESKITEDWSSVRTTYDGSKENPTGFHEYQNGWLLCENCGGGIDIDICLDDIPDREINKTLINAWNKRDSIPKEAVRGLIEEFDREEQITTLTHKYDYRGAYANLRADLAKLLEGDNNG